MLSVTCVECGVLFQYEGRGGRRRLYCSDACRNRPADLPRSCAGCGVPINGRARKWCSEACRARVYNSSLTDEQRNARQKRERERVRAKRAAELGDAPPSRCLNCNGLMHNRKGRFCRKSACRTAGYRDWRKRAPRCSIDGCDKPKQGKGLCGTHYAAVWRAANMDKYRAKNHRYRASKKTATVGENVSPQVVFETENWCCHICGKKINRRRKFPDQMSATLDHVVPLSKGGEHSYANCRAAHFICNSTKRDLGSGDQMMLLAVKAMVMKHGRSGTAA